jgi:hypothetical protein
LGWAQREIACLKAQTNEVIKVGVDVMVHLAPGLLALYQVPVHSNVGGLRFGLGDGYVL